MSTKTPVWSHSLSSVAWVNTVAISGNGSRLAGGTFRHDYTNSKSVQGTYGTFVYDSAGHQLWADTFDGPDGIFAVAMSDDGSVVACGGVFSATAGLLRIFDGTAGGVLFDSTAAAGHALKGRVSVVSLSASGSVAAAAAGELYVFVQSGLTYVPAVSTAPASDPNFQTALKTVAAVAVHPSGEWLVACNQQGQVLVAVISGGKITRVALSQTIEEPVNPASKTSPKAPVRFLSVATATNGDAFIAAGGDVVYGGSWSGILSGNQLSRYDAWDPTAPVGSKGKPKPNVRWAAISADGTSFAAVANRNVGGQLLIYEKETPTPIAKAMVQRDPNSVSMDGAGKIIAVSDGYPVGTASNIYRFDPEGNQIWLHATPDMNWPVAVSADGSGIAAGGDDGTLSYFLP